MMGTLEVAVTDLLGAGLAITVSLGLVLLLLVRRSAAERELTLRWGFLALIGVVPIAVFAPRYDQPAPLSALMRGDDSPPVSSAPPSAATSAGTPTPVPPPTAHSAEPPSGEGPAIHRYLALAWAVGATWLLVRWLARHLALRRIVRVATSFRPRRDGSPRVLVSDRVTIPLAVGAFGEPAVLLPVSARGWSEERLRLVLAHEGFHLRRHDPRFHSLAVAATAIHWVNPLAWILLRRFTHERETSCDDAVIRLGEAPSTYARQLLLVAGEAGMIEPSSSPAMARGEIASRVTRLLREDVPRRDPSPAAKIVVATMIVAGALGGGRASWMHARPLPTSNGPSALTTLDAAELARIMRGLRRDTELDVATMRTVVATLADRRHVPASALGFLPSEPRYGGLPETSPGKEAARVLVELGSDAVPWLLPVLDADRWPAREHATWALGRIGARSAVPQIERRLLDESTEVRRIAAWALGEMRASKAVAALVSSLADEHADVRAQAAWSLGDIGDRTATTPLLDALRDASPQVRRSAAHALGDLRDRRAAAALRAATRSDTDLRVRAMARWAIRETSGG